MILRSTLSLAFMTGATLPLSGQFMPVEDFEGSGMTVGQTFDAVNGWVIDTPARSLVQNDPAAGVNGKVGQLVSGSRNDSYKPLGGASIANNATGTLFFEVYVSAGPSGTNWNVGLSDQATPDNYAAFEPQFRIDVGNGDISPRNGGGFTDTGYDVDAGVWIQVWMVADNTTDKVDMYVNSPSGQTGQILVADDFGFRNGTTGALETFLTISSGSVDVYIDNIFVDPSGSNLALPPIAGLEPVAVGDTVEVGVQGAVKFNPLANDSGSVDVGSVSVVSGPGSGSVSVDPMTGEVVYRHTGSGAEMDTFRYRVANPGATDFSEADVAVSISGSLRLANSTVNVPLEPPAVSAGALTVENGLPGLTFPDAVAITSVPGTPEALLVASINGMIWYVPDSTVAAPTKHAVLNVSSLSNFTRGRSIYSIECYPDFTTSGNIIVNYQGDASRLPMSGGSFDTGVITGLDKNGAPNTTIECDLRVSRFTLSAAHVADAVANGMNATENQAALATEFPFINLAEQHLFHSINDCKFGPDGYLYVSFGDEGDQGSPYRNAQELTKDVFSSLIRIDVDPDSTNPYPSEHYSIAVGPLTGGVHGFFTDALNQTPNFRVPADNPFLHASKGGTAGWDGTYDGIDLSSQLDRVRSEIWAFGLRNPFKFHIDQEDGSGETEVWVGDVGKDAREEFSILKKGENGGWSYYEGDIITPGLSYTPNEPTGTTPHKAPLYAYPHGTLGNSATGGVFYRDTALSALTGKYICGDYGSGRIWSIERNGTVAELTNLRLGGGDIVDFHVDPVTKDIFVLEHSGSGRVMRITEQGGGMVENYPLTLSETRIFADLVDLAPNPGVIPYSPNLKFWSDGADKKRWFVIKNLVDTIGYSEDGNWTFPEGMILVKHFDYDLDQQNPGTDVKRLETRLLVRNASGSYGVSYIWNEEGTEANLVATEGVDFPINFTNNEGVADNLTWHIPSRAECLTCHTATVGHGLSLSTRQLNKDFTISGQNGNQLSLLETAGYLTGSVGDPAGIARHYRPDETTENLEARVRSYLAVNCSYCHQPGGGTPSSWDGRAHLTLEQTNLLYGHPVSEGTPDHTDHMIRPGDKSNSSIWNKINARNAISGLETFNGYSQMPPLATNRLDEEGIALLEEWIDNYANVAPTPADGQASLSENSNVGAAIGLDAAVDPDVRGAVTDQSQLTYTILSGNEQRLFTLNPTTGELSVNGILDYERQPQHVLNVEITDNFAPNPGITHHTIVIDLVDETSPDATADGNGNGIYDVWESGFGLVDPEGSDDSGDHDGNPLFYEFLSGGSPLVSESPSSLGLGISSGLDPGKAQITWRVRNGFVLGPDYKLQQSTNLTGWNDMMASEYEVVSITDDGPGISRVVIRVPFLGQRFVRLRSVAGP